MIFEFWTRTSFFASILLKTLYAYNNIYKKEHESQMGNKDNL